jgi:hypothetical protein
VAARLQTAAEPGGICISGSVHDQIVNKLSLSFQSLGEKSYKNIQQPVRTFSITETEGRRPLPSPKPAGPPRGAAKWIAGVIVALLAVGGGYWAYTIRERNNVAQPAPANATVSQPTQPTPESATPSAAAPAATPPAPTTKAAAPTSPPTAMKAAAPRPAPSGTRLHNHDGEYSGKICYMAFRTEPLQCHDRAGTIHGDKITGQWLESAGRDVTMNLSGDIDPSGHVTILMHSQYPDGVGVSTINLSGTVHEKVLDASGNSRRGRPVTIYWQKTSKDPH